MLNRPTTVLARCPAPSCRDHANARGRILVRPGGIFQRGLGLDHSTVRSVAAWSSRRLTSTPRFPPHQESKCPSVLIGERSQSCSENDESSPKHLTAVNCASTGCGQHRRRTEAEASGGDPPGSPSYAHVSVTSSRPGFCCALCFFISRHVSALHPRMRDSCRKKNGPMCDEILPSREEID